MAEHAAPLMDSAAPRVSVVVPARDAETTILAQLEALGAQELDEPWELIVVDNGSTDRTGEVLDEAKRLMAGIRVVRATEGVGINFSRNAGVRAAQGELILICDADDVVHPGWIAAHVSALERFDLSGGPLDESTLNTEEVASFNAGKTQTDCPIAGRFLPYATGGNFGFRRRVWERLGGFDDAWQRGHTETEFCWRAQLAGFTIGWAKDAVVAYRHGDSLRSEVRRRFRSAAALVRLYAQFRRHGMPRTRVGAAARSWAWLVYRIPWALANRDWRMKWLQVVAWRAGLLYGSLRQRVLYL